MGISFIPSPGSNRFSNDTLVGDFKVLEEGYIANYRRGVPTASAKLLDKVCGRIHGDLHSVDVKRHPPNLPLRLRKALRGLRDNEKIVISKADKGDAVVVMDRQHYLKLAWDHLGDESTYAPLTTDPTPEIANRFNAYIARCLNDKVIDAGLADRLRLPPDTCTQCMYFLPKIHKYPVKIRPIVSCTGGPTSRASGYLDGLLQPFMKRVNSYVENSTEIVNTLEDMTLPCDTLLCTLDINSLYTNITHEQAILAVTRRLCHHPRFVFILDLLKFVLKNNVFKFDGRTFTQKCGIAMGTKLAPALATIVVADLEDKFLRETPEKPLLLRRYIDDVLLLWQHTNTQLQRFIDGLNGLAPRLHFTHEVSVFSAVFLDLYLYKPADFSTRGKLSTTIYYKPTNTFSYALGTSYIHPNIQRGIAIGETVRMLRNTDRLGKFRFFKNRIIARLRARRYPTRAIRAIERIRFQDRQKYLNREDRQGPAKPLPLNTPYYDFKQPVGHMLKKRWREATMDPFLSVAVPTAPFLAFKNHPTLGRILSHKRKEFQDCPSHPSLQPDHMAQFTFQKFNRPRRAQDRQKLKIPTCLRRVDRSCNNKRCTVCPRLSSAPYITSHSNGRTIPTNNTLHCQSKGVIYALACRRCGKQYVGQTTGTMRHRLAQHRSRLRSAPMSLYSHFIRYHRTDCLDVTVTFLEQVRDGVARLEREKAWIVELGTTIPRGLNNPIPSTYCSESQSMNL